MRAAASIKNLVRRVPGLNGLLKHFDFQSNLDAYIIEQLAALPAGGTILDAGCGSQRFRAHCAHLTYKAQDFGAFENEAKRTFVTPFLEGNEVSGYADEGYRYGKLDYVGDIWSIDERDAYFDAILCTEVLEHIPYPIEAVREFARLLKPGGTLILTAPSACLRHMDPFFFQTGLSDRWYETILPQAGFEIERLDQVGDYYAWMAYELGRSALTHSFLAKLALLPAFLFFNSRTPTETSRNSLCFAYRVVATRKSDL
ncbi:class I SAM-dependent methyltransferase [Tsuneonella sp. YG55]|uniref:Class I SAM-dependent methyltransferase n=1 Tax=Tsuneonella litorea TaxID=2976475 RepID=A0A9X2VZN7_9SPHN|nr:class I SAM-dependent methyltransferase [Tsuneonella litorea]MCT2557953.1 class I SAM-dependent methyltransferase [Tsuneonella litorea]